jgi:ATP synthase F1 gamma subunit
MSAINEQKERIADVEAAHYITGTMRDISAIKLASLTKRFDQNTQFYTELTSLYQLVWAIAQERGVVPPRTSKERRLYVAYTTNRHFYGALNANTMYALRNRIASDDEVLVVGDTGRQMWRDRGGANKVQYLSFAGDDPGEDEVRAFLQQVEQYDSVVVLYPKFVSVFRQEVGSVDISFRPDYDKSAQDAESLMPQFLLEPDVQEMIEFFNKQVRYALLERILLETQLSRVSARLVKMDTADQNAQDMLHTERMNLHRAYKSVASRQMLETLVGFIQWHNTRRQPIVR